MPTADAYPDSAVDPLADLRRRFVDRSRQRIKALGDALAVDAPDIEAIAPLAHQLAGSAGTFGYAALSRAAATLEDAVRAAGGANAWIDASQLQAQFLALETAFEEIDAVVAACRRIATTVP